MHYYPSRFVSFIILSALCITAQAGSETPPPGAPWKRSFDEAHRQALKTGRPIFVYFTKTY
ncbi:MAG: hypothetical protein CMJ48_06300 [Planctomycetaceae bacterium]|nr:hypothetical protein [Planctomycetaceae bacterium]